MTQIEDIRIVLVEPEGEGNIGAIARVMRNMALTELVIVSPKCNPFSGEAKKMAVHGIEVLMNAKIVNSVIEALQGCQKAIATTAREREVPTPLETPKEALPWLLEDASKGAILFGPESRGLSNEELSHAQRFVRIPANPQYPSLNLAQAVGICAYELYQIYQAKTQKPPQPRENHKRENHNLATIEQLEGYYQHLERILLRVGYLQPHTAKITMEKLKRIINRGQLSDKELAMLRGMLRQVEWALDHPQPP
ncbi:MAG: RNA methyltransferase [Geminocystis sp.]|nr:RNA methyltransferase [Geminocystis sp.]HIK37085.1 RNA methyltransferase [Geminocystis sp. M7585_C2015_104]MCS7148609.1 RNA methyltransferase [Geminocystis sp.]MCX8079383.1 RNA methyltransferase [Geminocystis sp.]MDW8114999.1 RNA methyltransferase [Geminocystis sp.]